MKMPEFMDVHHGMVGITAEGLKEALAEAERALALQMQPVALELLKTPRGLSLVARVAGTASGVSRILGELGWKEEPDAFWAEHALAGSDCWARLSAPRGSLPALLDALPEGARWAAQPGVGTVQWFGVESATTFLGARRAAESAGGSAVLLAAYVAGVALFQFVLAPFTAGNGIAVAISTLAVVALFQPLRSRTRAGVDRRFYRSRYNAEHTLDRLVRELSEEVDLSAVRGRLLAVIGETLEPTHVSVWFRERPR